MRVYQKKEPFNCVPQKPYCFMCFYSSVLFPFSEFSCHSKEELKGNRAMLHNKNARAFLTDDSNTKKGHEASAKHRNKKKKRRYVQSKTCLTRQKQKEHKNHGNTYAQTHARQAASERNADVPTVDALLRPKPAPPPKASMFAVFGPPHKRPCLINGTA